MSMMRNLCIIRFINKQLFYDQRKQQNAGNKLRTYRTFKTNIKQEKKCTDT